MADKKYPVQSPEPTTPEREFAQQLVERATADPSLTGRHTMTPVDKVEVYQQLGPKLTYKPGLRIIEAEANPDRSCTGLCPRPELISNYMIVFREELVLT